MEMPSKINSQILRYIEMVESGEIEACEEQYLLVALVRRCFETKSIYTDDEQLMAVSFSQANIQWSISVNSGHQVFSVQTSHPTFGQEMRNACLTGVISFGGIM